MTQLAGWLSSNTATLSIFGAAVAFIWSTILQIAQRKAEAAERQFQAFHKVIAWVVAPEKVDGLSYVDKQAAAIFELRNFPAITTLRSACWRNSRGSGRLKRQNSRTLLLRR